MLNQVVKVFLVLTSFAPIFITWAFINFINQKWIWGVVLFGITVLLVILCLKIISMAKRDLQILPITIATVRTADKEILGFVLAYLLPLASATPAKPNLIVLGFVCFILICVVLSTNVYHFNPLLGFFGFHFYEVTSTNITYVLITKKDLRKSQAIKQVVQLTEYILLDAD